MRDENWGIEADGRYNRSALRIVVVWIRAVSVSASGEAR